MKFINFLILFVFLIPCVYSAVNLEEYKTYCVYGEDCNLTSLNVGNLTVYDDYLNVSVTNYNVTGDIDITNNINIGNDLIFSYGEYITSTAFDDLNIYADDDINLYSGGLLSIDGNVLPTVNMAHDIGSTGLMWDNVYASNFYDDGVLLVNIEADGIYLYNDSDTIYFNETRLNTTIEANAPSIEYFYNDSDTLYLNSSYYPTLSSKMFYSNNSVIGETATGYSYKSDITIPLGSMDTTTSITGLDMNIDYTHDGIFSLPTIKGINMDIDITKNAGTLLGSITPVKIDVDASTDYLLTGGLFDLNYVGGLNSGAWQTGGMNVEGTVYGTHNKAIALQSKINSHGSGDIYGYLGYAYGESGYSGNAYGVEGMTALSSTATATETAGIISEPAIINSQGLQKDKIMTFKGSNGHIYNYGSAILKSSLNSPFNPNGTITDHLDFNNNLGELYVEGIAEFDDVAYMDGGLVITTTTSQPSSPIEGQIIVDTNNNKVQCYADGAWRDLATW